MTPDEVRALPATVGIPAAGRCFGRGRDTSTRLPATDVPGAGASAGRRMLVSRANLLAVLGIVDGPEPADLRMLA